MAGLLNIRSTLPSALWHGSGLDTCDRPLAVVFTVISFAVTIHFKADVNAQGGAYATGVLVLMTSAAFAVTISVWRKKRTNLGVAFGLVMAVFVYTTIVNIIERPDGIKIASFFIGTIICTSVLSRVWRATELRVGAIVFDETAQRFLDALGGHEVHIIANKRQAGDAREYSAKEKAQREYNRIPVECPVLFLEVDISDASEFSDVLYVRGSEVSDHEILCVNSPVVPNAIAAILLYLRDKTGQVPHAYFSWSQGNPITFMLRYFALGEGDTAPTTHEVLRKA